MSGIFSFTMLKFIFTPETKISEKTSCPQKKTFSRADFQKLSKKIKKKTFKFSNTHSRIARQAAFHAHSQGTKVKIYFLLLVEL